MRINFKIVATALSVGWASESVANYRNKRKAKQQLQNAQDAFNAIAELNDYLAARLDANQVMLDEFDKIAINSITIK